MDLGARDTTHGLFLFHSKVFFYGSKLRLSCSMMRLNQGGKWLKTHSRDICIITSVGHPIKQYVQDTQV
jgi:hypothetical protein